MKRSAIIIGLIFLIFAANSFSQTVRYRDEVFSAYTLASNIVYGTGSKNVLDLYTGTGDAATNRPLIIYVHGGAFSGGDKDPNSGAGGCGFLRYFGYGMAKRGYVVASINYRTGSWSGDAAHYKAMLNALQDTKAAIRFFRKNAALYGVDTSHIYVVGQSAGGHTAAQMACLDSVEVEKFSQWSSIGWSAVGGSLENPALGNAGYSSSFNAAISCWGALVDTNYMQAGGMPIYCVHGTADATVPYIYGTTDSPFNYGSQLIYNRAQNLGIASGLALYPGKGHSLDSDAASQTDAYAKCGAWLYNIYTNVSVPITLYSPAGGELWQNGTVHPITWLAAASIANVNIDYSVDNGVTWTNIVSNTPANASSYSWTVPNTLSTTCRVKITNSADASVVASSSSVFTITAYLPPAITLNTPAGAETFTGGFPQMIKWTSVNVTNIKIEFSSDNGATWSTVAASVPAASGSYSWSVPNIDASQCLIRLSDLASVAPSSVNNDLFNITKSNFSGTILLEENFVAPADTSKLISGYNGWNTVTGTNAGTQISFIDSNLVFTGYPEGTGKAAFYSLSSTHKIYKNFTAPTSGVIYMSFLIKIPTAAQTFTNHIIGLGSGDMSTLATYSLKTYCKWNATTLGYNFGLTTGSTSTYSATPTTLPAGKVGLVVLKYDITNNTEDLYVIPEGTVFPATLPATSEVHLTGGTAFVPNCVYFRSQTTLTISSIVDGIRVATFWGDAATDVKQSTKENQSFKLMQNYPNPFNPSTTISYQINQDSPVTLKVFNMLGKEVAALVSGFKPAGNYSVQFNASNLSSGVYYTELRSGEKVQVNKMLLMK